MLTPWHSAWERVWCCLLMMPQPGKTWAPLTTPHSAMNSHPFLSFFIFSCLHFCNDAFMNMLLCHCCKVSDNAEHFKEVMPLLSHSLSCLAATGQRCFPLCSHIPAQCLNKGTWVLSLSAVVTHMHAHTQASSCTDEIFFSPIKWNHTDCTELFISFHFLLLLLHHMSSESFLDSEGPLKSAEWIITPTPSFLTVLEMPLAPLCHPCGAQV